MRRIVALGGSGAVGGPLESFLLELTGKPRPRVTFLPTAVGDNPGSIVLFYERFTARDCDPRHVELFGVPEADIRGRLLESDLIWVSGGNTANMLAVWRVHGVDRALRDAWDAGILLSGWSAGGICWFEGGVTDSFGPELAALDDGLGFLSGTFCPHYDGEVERRPTYTRLVREGFGEGIAADDAVGVCFEGTNLVEVVTERPEATAYRVERTAEGIGEQPLEARVLR